LVGAQIGNQFFARAFGIHLCFFCYAGFAFVDLFADGLDIRRLNGSSFHKGDFLNGLFEKL
jgi:hypothetical protein